MKLKRISKYEFDEYNHTVLFQDKKTDRVFGMIFNHKITYQFAWQSDRISPLLFNVGDSIYLIGIDLDVVIIDANTGERFLSLKLDYFFFDAKVYDDHVYVLTELEVIKVNYKTFKIEKLEIPDYFEGIEFKDGFVEIKYIGGARMVKV